MVPLPNQLLRLTSIINVQSGLFLGTFGTTVLKYFGKNRGKKGQQISAKIMRFILTLKFVLNL